MGLKNKPRTNKLTVDSITMLNTFGFMAWRQNNHATPNRDKNTGKIVSMRSMPTGSRKGVSDILAVAPQSGILYGIEIKVGNDRQSPDQVEFMNDLQNKGAGYVVISCIDDLIDFLNDWRAGKL